ncbi:ABC transporter permease [Cellulomonas endophytica]|uniref:ABC transporter permease n=1 Tax=Cellulomonas endophytica TaxID=2494735 RepID=UPI001011894B|nr:ABC transporter permease [Cellulomonas endophytica]
MSTATLSPAAVDRGRPGPSSPATRVTFARVLRAERIKLWSLRSTWWTLGLTVVAFVGMVAGMSALVRSLAPEEAAEAAAGGAPLSAEAVYSIAVQPASLAAVVLGVLVITGEYSTGMIRSTFAAVPRRLPALWAKAIVVFAVMLLTAALAVAIGVAVSWLILDGRGLALDLSEGDNLRLLGGSALYLATLALFAFAVGALVRHSAGALATVFGLLLVVENVVAAVPWEPLRWVRPFLPASAGSRVTLPEEWQGMFANEQMYAVDPGLWGSYAILVAWAAVLLAIAAVLVRRRDA